MGYMDDAGIDRAVAMGFPWQSESDCHLQNEYFGEAVKHSRRRILAFGSIPPRDAGNSGHWVSRITALGLSGIGETGFYRDGFTGENARSLDAMLHSAAAAHIPLCLHVNEPLGHAYPGKYDPAFDRLCGVLANHPAAEVILAHLGGGLLFYELMPEIARILAGCVYDTAAAPYLYRPDVYRIACSIVGPRRVLFGSDYPLLHASRYVDDIRKAIGSKEEQRLVLAGNAGRILCVGEDA